MDTSIVLRIKRFLQQVPPFSLLAENEIQQLADKVKVSVYKKNEKAYSPETQTREYFYLVKKGAFDIIKSLDNATQLVDKCGEGDFFGIVPLLSQSSYRTMAICAEDSIVYEIPFLLFKKFYSRNAEAANFMIQHLAVARDTGHTLSSKKIVQPFTPGSIILRPSTDRKLITIHPLSSIQEAIETMHSHAVSSIIVLGEKRNPVGIITDRDIRNFVAAGYKSDTLVNTIMSHPVKCIPSDMTLPEIQLTMIESGFHHLCITENGKNDKPCLGIITQHDLLYASASDPIVILKKIKKATTVDSLCEIRIKIDKLLPVFLQEVMEKRVALEIITRLNHALIKQAIHLSLGLYNKAHPECQINENMFAFLNLGSAARGEQLLMTDQDNTIVIANQYGDKKSSFLSLAEIITSSLHKIGYDYCPAKMMASNPDWCLTIQQFEQKIKSWLLNPGPKEVMLTTIFFDFRYVYGNQKIANALKDYTYEMLKKQDLYIRFLASQAVKNPPPLSFFRNFIIEKDGKHKDFFDIKLRGIAPLMDAARVLAFDIPYLDSSNTWKRFTAISKKDPANAPLYKAAQNAYLDLLAIKLETALSENNSGQFINPQKLDKIQKNRLRNCFDPAKRLHSILERKYNLSYFQ